MRSRFCGAYWGRGGRTDEIDHLSPIQTDHPEPIETDHLRPIEIDHLD